MLHGPFKTGGRGLPPLPLVGHTTGGRGLPPLPLVGHTTISRTKRGRLRDNRDGRDARDASRQSCQSCKSCLKPPRLHDGGAQPTGRGRSPCGPSYQVVSPRASRTQRNAKSLCGRPPGGRSLCGARAIPGRITRWRRFAGTVAAFPCLSPHP